MLVSAIILIPFLLAIVMLLVPKDYLRSLSIVASFGMLALSFLAYYFIQSGTNGDLLYVKKTWIHSMQSSWHMELDNISMLMVFLATIVGLLVFGSIRRSSEFTNSFYASAWTMLGAMIGVFCTRDGLVFYVFWELALIPIYFICLIWGGENREKVTFKFFVYTLFGSLFMLAAFLYLYKNSTGGWELSALIEAGKNLSILEQNLVFWGIFVGFAIKMPIFPFHTWQPDTYHEAPTQGTMLLSGIMLKMSTYGVYRWLAPVVPGAMQENSQIVIWLAVGGLVYASIVALVQKDFKKMMAWASIAHVGLIGAGLFVGNQQATAGAFIQMLAHGINVVAGFYVVDIIYHRLKTHNMESMGGIRSISPLFATFFMIIMFGTIALPLTNGFIGEFMLLSGIFQFNAWVALVAGLSVILGAVYMLRAYQSMMLGPVNENSLGFSNLETGEKVMLTIFCGLIIFFGLFPNSVLHFIEPSFVSSLSLK